jgi:2-polyprenyl-6-methoxyphenol hydroxylase-like FAD-dependent oxidoreductase
VTVLIIGAGIGGLTTAIALIRAGIAVEVFERTATLGEIGAGISLWANALAALDTIGLAKAVRTFSAPGADAALRTWRGRVLVGSSDTMLARRLGDLVIVMHRADLQQVLLDALGRERVTLGCQCVSVAQGDRGVTATFADGRTACGDALVGADGIHSVVRAALHGHRPPDYVGYTAWRSVVTFDHARLQPGETWGFGSRFGQIPMNQGRVYWFATVNAPEGARGPQGEKAELRRIFRGWHDPIEALIEATDERTILRNDIYDRPVLSRWGDGRVTLLGDAAHPMTPNLGQGACQAIEDAVALAGSLSRATNVPAALHAYEVSRIPRANHIVKVSRRVGAVAQLQHPWMIAARDLLVRRAGGRMQAKQLEKIVDALDSVKTTRAR